MHQKRKRPLDTGHAHFVAGLGRHAAAGGQDCRRAGNRGGGRFFESNHFAVYLRFFLQFWAVAVSHTSQPHNRGKRCSVLCTVLLDSGVQQLRFQVLFGSRYFLLTVSL